MSSHGSPAAAGTTPVILSLGSNLGDRRAHLERGLRFLARHLEIDAVSRVVESAPWGPVLQGDFLNLLVRARTCLPPLELLEVLQAAEADAGRERRRPKGPRTLDVDLVFFGTLRLDHPRLRVPHPGWRERPFVFELIGDVAGSMSAPGSDRLLREVAPTAPLSDALRQVAPLAEVAPLADDAVELDGGEVLSC